MCLLAACISLEKCLLRFRPCFFVLFFLSLFGCVGPYLWRAVLLPSPRAFSLQARAQLRRAGSAALRPFVCSVELLLLRRVSCLYILEVRPLSVIPFANIFPFCRFPPLFMFSFSVQKLVPLLSSRLLISVVASAAVGDWPEIRKHWNDDVRECFVCILSWEFYGVLQSQRPQS